MERKPKIQSGFGDVAARGPLLNGTWRQFAGTRPICALTVPAAGVRPEGQITWSIYRPLCPAPFEKIF